MFFQCELPVHWQNALDQLWVVFIVSLIVLNSIMPFVEGVVVDLQVKCMCCKYCKQYIPSLIAYMMF